jgi:hypothetical protein
VNQEIKLEVGQFYYNDNRCVKIFTIHENKVFFDINNHCFNDSNKAWDVEYIDIFKKKYPNKTDKFCWPIEKKEPKKYARAWCKRFTSVNYYVSVEFYESEERARGFLCTDFVSWPFGEYRDEYGNEVK